MPESSIKLDHEGQNLSSLFHSDHQYKYLDSFITLFVAILLISNIVATKFVAPVPAWGWFRVSCAQMLFPITYIFGDIFTEVYGYSASRRAIWFGFLASGMLALICYLCVILPPAPEYHDQAAFQTIFNQVGRVVAGSLLAFWCGEFANSFTLAKLKLLTNGKHLWTRTVGSTVVGQAVDTTIVVLAIFGGKEPPATLVKLIFSGYIIKVIYETLMTPFTYAIVNYLKRTENADYFDRKTNFNPFATRN